MERYKKYLSNIEMLGYVEETLGELFKNRPVTSVQIAEVDRRIQQTRKAIMRHAQVFPMPMVTINGRERIDFDRI